ncbi:MAG: hypothetical protein JWR19_292 [Pedosphaera sp.]|nr:hypothetical protein [Pedosphaera sp.]
MTVNEVISTNSQVPIIKGEFVFSAADRLVARKAMKNAIMTLVFIV